MGDSFEILAAHRVPHSGNCREEDKYWRGVQSVAGDVAMQK
jgi:hypothetical protein